MSFSKLKKDIAKFEIKEDFNSRIKVTSGFSSKELTKEAIKERILKSESDFFYFDKIYFPSEMYGDGYSEPCQLHYDLLDKSLSNQVEIVLAPRKHGKTVTAKKIMIWLLLTKRIKNAGVYAETVPKSSEILLSINELIFNNDRLKIDYEVTSLTANSDQINFTFKGAKGKVSVASFSEGRSLRGYIKGFDRPDFLLCDDVETIQSSFSEDSVKNRIRKLSEAYQSLSEKGTMLVLGNDFDDRGALHRLRLEQENGLKNEKWNISVYQAWADGKALWDNRFKVNSESEYKEKVGVINEADWQGNYQQNPIPDDGIVFERKYLNITHEIADDARGVIYCDPNLSKKSKGDTTAIISLLYSPSMDLYFIDNIFCRSINNPNDLLDLILEMKKSNHRAVGFDGHVNQESHWTSHIRNYCQIKSIPYPIVDYKRYHVDDLSKNASLLFSSGKILFKSSAIDSKDGERFLQQLFAFAGKKAGKKDDAPDALICAIEFISERRLNKKKSNGSMISFIKESIF